MGDGATRGKIMRVAGIVIERAGGGDGMGKTGYARARSMLWL